MTTEFSRLQFKDSIKSTSHCLSAYLEDDLNRAKTYMSGPEAEFDCQVFREGIANLTEIVQEFLSSKSKALAVLALGKIQSGKTAHMLGTIAWAVDTKIALATIFTGINGDLNNQTVTRLHKSLGALDQNFIKVFLVPTNHHGKDYAELRDALDGLIISRISRSKDEVDIPLPVLATLKTIQRINTLEFLHAELSEKYGSDLVSLLLDDEADQASQNSGASKGEVTKIYEAISKVRKSLVRNVYLGYTATPQAVLLTERFGNLRPDLAVLVPPRANYFGLDEVVSDKFSSNLVEIQDWNGTSVSLTQIPQSLKDAMHDYLWVSSVRFAAPDVFFAESRLTGNALNSFMKSTQMMIHESSRVAFHRAMFNLVSAELNAYKDDLLGFGSGIMPSEDAEKFLETLEISWNRVRGRLPVDIKARLPKSPTSDLIQYLLDIVSDTEIVVVNGDKARPNSEVNFPVENTQWTQHKSWICIGGDILGRGLTIPHLLTTYFLRSSKVPNFDTVSQQMRFCGYRKGYMSFTSIWAESSTFLSFRYMREIESVVWNRVKRWDQERLRINVEIPRVLYASPISTRMEPTRKSVRDPNLVDTKVKGEVIFSAAKIMQPHAFRHNFALTRRWMGDLEGHLKQVAGWYLLEDLGNADIYSLLSEWCCDPSERARMLGTMELFAADMAALGLANVPRACFIAKDVLEYPPLRDERDMQDLASRTKFYRTVTNLTETVKFSDWAAAVIDNTSDTTFNSVSVTHIGGTLRNLKSLLDFDSTIFVIEFMRGVQGKGVNAMTISLGMTLTILSPANYEVRTIGHS